MRSPSPCVSIMDVVFPVCVGLCSCLPGDGEIIYNMPRFALQCYALQVSPSFKH